MYRRRVPIKLAFLGESTGICSIVWVIKQSFHGCLVESGADPGFLDRGFKLAEGGSICAV